MNIGNSWISWLISHGNSWRILITSARLQKSGWKCHCAFDFLIKQIDTQNCFISLLVHFAHKLFLVVYGWSDKDKRKFVKMETRCGFLNLPPQILLTNSWALWDEQVFWDDTNALYSWTYTNKMESAHEMGTIFLQRCCRGEKNKTKNGWVKLKTFNTLHWLDLRKSWWWWQQ